MTQQTNLKERPVAKVVANMSMSLDGFVAGPADQVDELFAWMGGGDVEVPTAVEWVTFRVSAPSAAYLRRALGSAGALVAGRHLYDITGGWGGTHPLGVPVVVVTHTPPLDPPHPETFTFVDGVENAVATARGLAGDKNVVVASSTIASQCLDLDLLDEVHVDLVPVVLGEGVRWFSDLAAAPARLGTPTVVEGEGVTHLAYPVLRTSTTSRTENTVADVSIEHVEAQPMLSIRGTVPLAGLAEAQGERLTRLWDYLRRQRVEPAGPPFVRYHSFGEEETDVEVGVRVAVPHPGNGPITAGELPGGPAAVTRHLGSHDTLADAYGRLQGEVARQRREAGGAGWEVYEWIDPAVKPDPASWPAPAQWRTTLVQPLA